MVLDSDDEDDAQQAIGPDEKAAWSSKGNAQLLQSLSV